MLIAGVWVRAEVNSAAVRASSVCLMHRKHRTLPMGSVVGELVDSLRSPGSDVIVLRA